MSDFQMALAGIAIAVVVIVLLYNRWQESRYKKRAERAFGGDHADVLFGSAGSADRVEPSLGGKRGAAMDDIDEGLLAPIVAAPVMPKSSDDMAIPAVHADIDSIALVLADAPMQIDQFWPTIQQSKKVSRHTLWEGLVGGLWQPISENSDDAGYRELRAGLQLASRSGPVDAATIQAFRDMMGAFAAGIPGGVMQCEDVIHAQRRAQEIDAFCADTDVEIAINLVGKSGVTFATTKVRGLAESTGMQALPGGEYVMNDDLGQPQFTLRNMNASEPPGIRQAGTYLTGLTFALDVPRTRSPDRAFEKLMATALRFADALQGDVVDDNKRVLTANGRKAIVDTIELIVEDMAKKNVVAGSAAALRLYA